MISGKKWIDQFRTDVHLYFSGFQYSLNITWTHSEPRQISKMELSAKIINAFWPLTILAKSSILDV